MNIPRLNQLTLGIVLAGLILAICPPSIVWASGIHAYNKAKDKAAQSIQQSYTNVPLLKVFAIEQTNLNALAKAELDLWDRQLVLQRDLALFRALEAPASNLAATVFEDTVTNRLVDLLAPGTAVANAAALAQDLSGRGDNIKLARHDIDMKAREIQAVAGKLPSPFDLVEPVPEEPPKALMEGVPAEKIGRFKQRYKGYVDACRELEGKYTNRLGSGLIFQAFGDWKQGQQAYSAEVKLAEDKQSELIAKSKALATLLKKQGKGSIADATNKLAEVRKALEALEKSGVLGKQKAVDSRLEALKSAIEALALRKTTNSLGAAADPGITAPLKQIGGLLSGVAEVEKAASSPKLSWLLIQKEMLQVEKETADQQAFLLRSKVKCREDKFIAMLLEMEFLNEITRAGTGYRQSGIRPPDPAPGTSIAVYLSSKDMAPELRTFVWKALINYASSYRVARREQERADLALVHLDFQAAVTLDEASVRTWNALIATPINRLMSYHSSGFKPTEVADILVKALGLGAIAWRVK